MRTTTSLPLTCDLTRTRVPKGSVLCAAVSSLVLKRSPLAVRLPWKRGPYHEAMPDSIEPVAVRLSNATGDVVPGSVRGDALSFAKESVALGGEDDEEPGASLATLPCLPAVEDEVADFEAEAEADVDDDVEVDFGVPAHPTNHHANTAHTSARVGRATEVTLMQELRIGLGQVQSFANLGAGCRLVHCIKMQTRHTCIA